MNVTRRRFIQLVGGSAAAVALPLLTKIKINQEPIIIGVDLASGPDETVIAYLESTPEGMGFIDSFRYIESEPLKQQDKPIHNNGWQKFTKRKKRRS